MDSKSVGRTSFGVYVVRELQRGPTLIGGIAGAERSLPPVERGAGMVRVDDKAGDASHNPQLLRSLDLLRWDTEEFVPRYQFQILRHVHIHREIGRSEDDGRDTGGLCGSKVPPEGVQAEAKGNQIRWRHQQRIRA